MDSEAGLSFKLRDLKIKYFHIISLCSFSVSTCYWLIKYFFDVCCDQILYSQSFLCAHDMDEVAASSELTETGISSFVDSPSLSPLLHSSVVAAPARPSMTISPSPPLPSDVEEEESIYAFSSQEKQLVPREAQMESLLSDSAIKRVRSWRQSKKQLLEQILTVYVEFKDNIHGKQRRKKRNSKATTGKWGFKKTRLPILYLAVTRALPEVILSLTSRCIA